jgi:hypothetical protein
LRIDDYIRYIIPLKHIITISYTPVFQASYHMSNFIYISNIKHIFAVYIEVIYQSSALKMSPTEMIQTGALLPLAQPTTLPSSPNLPFEHIVTLNNAQQFIEMVKAIVAMEVAPTTLASKCTCSHMPPENPNPQVSTRVLTADDLEWLILKLIKAKSSKGPNPSSPGDTQTEGVVAQTSRLEFKMVNEVYVSNGVQVPVS